MALLGFPLRAASRPTLSGKSYTISDPSKPAKAVEEKVALLGACVGFMRAEANGSFELARPEGRRKQGGRETESSGLASIAPFSRLRASRDQKSYTISPRRVGDEGCEGGAECGA